MYFQLNASIHHLRQQQKTTVTSVSIPPQSKICYNLGCFSLSLPLSLCLIYEQTTTTSDLQGKEI